MIFYQDMNDQLHCFDSEFFDNQRDSDALLRIAIDITAAGYPGVVIHSEPLASGQYFFGVNFLEDTLEGAIFGKLRSDFDKGRPLPDSRSVLKRICMASRRQAKT